MTRCSMIEALGKLFHGLELAIIGAIGSAIALRFHPEVQGKKQAIIFIITGACIAHFCTGLVADYLSIQPSRAGAVGFIIGLFGASLIDAIGRAIKNADLWAFITSKWGAK